MMATAKPDLDSIVSEELECAICLDRLDKPRILSCLHSFCETCLLKCAENEDSTTLECSLCKTTTTLPPTGVSGLKVDFRAARLLEALAENEKRKQKLSGSSQKCEACGYVDPSKKDSRFTFCQECSQVLCARCASTHAGLRSTQDHTVAKISDLMSGSVTIQPQKQVTYCPKHCDEKLKLFCLTCSEPICHDCTLFDHNRDEHDFKFLADLTNDIQTELTDKLSKVRSQTKKHSEFLRSLDKVDELIHKHGKTTVQHIEDTIQDHVDRVKTLGKLAVDDQEKCINEIANEVQELRQETRQMKELAQHSSLMTEKILGNSKDLIGMASMYKSLREALDKSIVSNPNEELMSSIKESVGLLHYHVTGTEAKVGSVKRRCECNQRNEINVTCRTGPKEVQFTYSGRLTVLTQDSPFPTQDTIYVQGTVNYQYGYNYKLKYRPNDNLTPSFKQTPTPLPYCKTFSWSLTIPTLQYDTIKCFATLSDNSFVIVDIHSKIYILTDTIHDITDMPHGLPENRCISGIATDSKDHIYLADKNNQRVYVIRDDGGLHKNISLEQISPTGIAVSHLHPDHIVVTHDPATVCIMDIEGKVSSIIHQDYWAKVNISCSTDRLHILWSDAEGKVTLERYTMEGKLVDTLIDKETYPCKDLLLAVSPDGSVAIVTATDKDGKVLVIHPRK